jgi:hypothetical protein
MTTMENFKPLMHTSLSLEGHYKTQIDNLECDLRLNLNSIGCLVGTFQAADENLEVYGGIPSLYGDVYGLMREGAHLETTAVFHAIPDRNGLLLELDLPGVGDLMKLGNASRLMFTRVSQRQTQADLPEFKALELLSKTGC